MEPVQNEKQMNDKVENALKRLNRILPLQASQDKCSLQVKELHQQMLRSFVTRGHIVSKAEMAQWVDDVPAAINVLSQYDMVIFAENGEPVGAYPFTMTAREHTIHVNGQQVYAMCALDALAIGPMFGETTRITSKCRVTEDPIVIEMSSETILNWVEVQDIYVGIAWEMADAGSCCADSLCMEMIFLRDGTVAQQWLAENLGGREIFALQDAVEFASRFFLPLMS